MRNLDILTVKVKYLINIIVFVGTHTRVCVGYYVS